MMVQIVLVIILCLMKHCLQILTKTGNILRMIMMITQTQDMVLHSGVFPCLCANKATAHLLGEAKAEIIFTLWDPLALYEYGC